MSTTNPEVTLEAIDVSAIVAGSAENAEVTALKKKVKKVADNYTRRYGWCDEVKKALAEIGIEEEKGVVVEVTLLSPATTLPVTVKPSLLHRKTAQEQATVLAGMLGEVKIVTPGGLTLDSRPMGGENVASMRLVEGVDASLVDAWMFTGPQGRVTHYLRGVNDPNRTRSWVYTACGDRVYPDGHGVQSSRPGVPSPPRCKRCEKATS